jgi:hypothetical protein
VRQEDQPEARPVAQQERSILPPTDGTPVYSAEECTGPIVAGKCHGGVIDTMGGNRPRCHGTMLNGQCTGPMF